VKKAGRIAFYNTASSSRTLSISVVSNTGATYATSMELAAHSAQSIEPSSVDTGDNFGVAVQIGGGGVVGEEIIGTNRSQVPCVAQGIRHWYGTGFDTTVGSSAYLSLYNPTGTSAVLNTTIFTAGGFSAPQSFQGLSVPAHTQMQVNLGSQVVNISNIGVAVNVLRGSLDIVGVQNSNGIVSLDQGETSLVTSATYPDVTTGNHTAESILVANPGAKVAQVSVGVTLGDYTISPRTATVSPYSTGIVTITPNSAIPSAGYSSLTLHSNVPVASALATGHLTWIALTPPEAPSASFLIRNFTGRGFDAVTVTNITSHTITISIATQTDMQTSTSPPINGIKVAPNTTQSLKSVIPKVVRTQIHTYIVSTSSPSMVVGLTLPSTPEGVNVVSALDGR
jgi:hypothetical protein